MCQGFSNLSDVLHHFVLAKLAPSSIRVNAQARCGIADLIMAIFTLAPSQLAPVLPGGPTYKCNKGDHL